MAHLKTSEHEKSELKSKQDELCASLQSVTVQLDDLTFTTTQSIADRDGQLNKLQTDIDAQIRQILSLKEALAEQASKLHGAEQELLDKATEFSAYKLRAQSMLRQTQTGKESSSNESELTDQLQAAQATVDSLTAQLQSVAEQKRQLTVAVDELMVEKQRHQQRCVELLRMLDESRAQLDGVQSEARATAQTHQESLKGLRLQIETLNECYKTQFADLTAAHECKLNELRAVASAAAAATAVASPPLRNDNEMRRTTTAVTTTTSSDEQKIDWLMMEQRQEGEGSESNINQMLASFGGPQRKSSRGGGGRRELIPLDELLNNSFEETTDNVSAGEFSAFDQQQLNEQLSIQKSR